MTGNARCVIVGGAPVERYDRIRGLLAPGDFAVYCDSGLRHRQALGLEPSLIVGDFDSWEDPHDGTETLILPREKDDTDTVFAAKEMLQRGCRDFLLVGAAGGRLDHTLANLSLLLLLDDAGARAVLADDSSLTRVVSREEVRIEDAWSYFSLLAAGGDAAGVTVTGAKYPLEDAALTSSFPLGVSNEVLPGETAVVRVGRGRLFLICDW